MEPGTIVAPPRPCPECGNLMIWGELHTQVEEHVGRYGFPRTSAAYHFVTRSDMPPTLGYPVVAAVCPVWAHLALCCRSSAANSERVSLFVDVPLS